MNQLADVLTFDRISGPHVRREMHGDIVIDVQPTFVETIGGNVGQSARRRRYPIDPTGRLVVARDQMFVPESDTEAFPALPVVNPAPGLADESTARIFAVLSLVEECVTIPGQQVGDDAELV
jgi:hypothetical protein